MFDPKPFSNRTQYTEEQYASLSTLHYINQIDENLRVVASIDIVKSGDELPPRVLLALELYFYNKKVDTLTFNLNNYNYDEIIELVKNIRSNEFLLQEIDNFLAGDIVE